jgi:hypothetical protein
MRRVLALVAIAIVAVGIYILRHDNASDRIRQEMLGVVSDMDLSPTGRDIVSDCVDHHHEQVFKKHFDPSRAHGKKFDVNGYYNDIGTLTEQALRADERTKLADAFRDQLPGFTLTVTER